MGHLVVLVHIAHMLGGIPAALGTRAKARFSALKSRDEGQAVTEYTLVILVAATVALLLLNWVQGGAIASFFDTIFSQVTGMFSS